MQEMLTGVVTGPGIPPTPGEHLWDTGGRWIGQDVLPVLADRSDPARFVILWDELPTPDWRADARGEAARAAERMRAAAPAAQGAGTVPDGAPGPDWVREMLAGLGGQIPAGAAVGQPIIITAETEGVDLTAGHLSAADAERLSAGGEPATAVLTGITDVQVPQAVLPGPTASLCDLSLEVRRSDGQTYPARTRLGFRDARRRAALTAPGLVLPVRIDPADPARVAVDVRAFDSRYASD